MAHDQKQEEETKKLSVRVLADMRGLVEQQASQLLLDAVSTGGQVRLLKSERVRLIFIRSWIARSYELDEAKETPTINQLSDLAAEAGLLLVYEFSRSGRTVKVVIDPDRLTVTQTMRELEDVIYTQANLKADDSPDENPIPGHDEGDDDSNPIPGHEEDDDQSDEEEEDDDEDDEDEESSIDEDEDRERERQREEDEEAEREEERKEEERRAEEEREREEEEERAEREREKKEREEREHGERMQFNELNEDAWELHRLLASAVEAGLRLTMTAEPKPSKHVPATQKRIA